MTPSARPSESAPAASSSSRTTACPTSSAGRRHARQAADAKLVGDLVAGFPFAAFHIWQFLACAVTYAACASTASLMPWLIQSMRTQLPLDAAREGFLTTSLYWGMALGSVASGIVEDVLGRRKSLCAGLGLLALLQFSVGMLVSFRPLAICLFLRGMVYIFVEGVAKTQLAECIPSLHRGLLLNLVHSVWQLGALAGTAITYRTSEYQPLALISSLGPILALLLALFASVESPMWLLRARGRAAAERSLRDIARACHAPPLPTPLFDTARRLSGTRTTTPERGRTISGKGAEGDIELAAAPGTEDAAEKKPMAGESHPHAWTKSSSSGGAAGLGGSGSRDGASSSGAHEVGQREDDEQQSAQQPRTPPESPGSSAPASLSKCSPLIAKECWPLFARRSARRLIFAISSVWIVLMYASLSNNFLLIRFLEDTGRANLQRPLRFTMFASKLGGGVLGAGAVDYLGRKAVFAPCFVITALGTIGLIVARSTAGLYASVILTHAANEVLWETFMTFSVEVFSTELRAEAVGLCIALGRVSASVSIGIGPKLMDEGRPALPFEINAFVLLVGAGLSIGLLPAETADTALR